MLIAISGLAAHGNETPAWLHPPAVVVQSSNGRIALLGDVLRTIQQIEEVHSTRIIVGFFTLRSEGTQYRGRRT